MKISSIVGFLLTIVLSVQIVAQETKPLNSFDKREKSEPAYVLSKRVVDSTNINTNKVVTPVIVETEVDPRPEGRVNPVQMNQESTTLSPSKPATRVNTNSSIQEVNYTLDNTVSDLDNLLNLMEYKFKINDAPNAKNLQESDKYASLITDIQVLRDQFNKRVISTGFENCSTRDQNYFLSFLKEENRMEEYQLYSSKINK
jgi:hypothetical protein